MKILNSVLLAVLLVAVGVLYYLHFKKDGTKPKTKVSASDVPAGNIPFRIAYFEMDSLEKHYEAIKDVRSKLDAEKERIAGNLNATKKKYQARVEQLQQQASTMSQQQGEQAQQEINQMQVSLQQQEAELTQQLQNMQFTQLQDINKKIEEYLKTYNQQKQFAFVISHSTGDFIYYKDSLCNVTADLVEGLNEEYKKTKNLSNTKK